MHKLTVHCNKCGSTYRVERQLPVTIIPNLPHYCMLCGSHACTAIHNADEDYWELLADTYNMPPKLIREIYAVWDWREYPKFSDFVASLEETKPEAV